MKKLILTLAIGSLLFYTTACNTQREVDNVSYNLSLEADNFNVFRKLTVINCISNDTLFQMEGKMSITADRSDNQLEVIVEGDGGTYQKHFIGLSNNVTYVVEQMNYKATDKYKYILNYNPKMWIPVTVKTVD